MTVFCCAKVCPRGYALKILCITSLEDLPHRSSIIFCWDTGPGFCSTPEIISSICKHCLLIRLALKPRSNVAEFERIMDARHIIFINPKTLLIFKLCRYSNACLS
ncbi:unnamed protein product [Meganyctiphanes norvegica]|uniref:Uncharacterized protein n=1 Tax=Meganyctiphanes norvegica TaxID=48144 RepID=A0AAV2Q636_MEGNR